MPRPHGASALLFSIPGGWLTMAKGEQAGEQPEFKGIGK